jgi:hypothetical protein
LSTVCVAVVSSPSASMAARASRSTTRWAPSGRAQGARLATSVNSELAGEVELLVGTTEAVTGNPHRVQRMRVGVRSPRSYELAIFAAGEGLQQRGAIDRVGEAAAIAISLAQPRLLRCLPAVCTPRPMPNRPAAVTTVLMSCAVVT